VHRKILIMGLPGSGKTTPARVLAPQLNAVHFDADETISATDLRRRMRG
jgi:adenylate kinase family enzyme